jgi:hypothetical protein
MPAGDSAEKASQLHILRAADHARLGRDFGAGSYGERVVAQALAPLRAHGWVLLEDRVWRAGSAANIDMILVGPGGIIVIDAKNWREAPTVSDGVVVHHETSQRYLNNVVDEVASVVSGLGISPVAVTGALVFVKRRLDLAASGVRVLGSVDAAAVFAGYPIRLSAAQVQQTATLLAEEFPAHGAAVMDIGFDQNSLFEIIEVDASRAAVVEAGPIEQWMTYLDQAQLGVVGRHWSGPARISGRPGTGKTVVGWHRAAYLARCGHRRLLFLTFARNLPLAYANVLKRMAPDVVARVRFENIHRWALRLLSDRRVACELDKDGIEDCYARAWLSARGRGLALEDDRQYWRDELDQVIKGRGITEFEEYRKVNRRGRVRPLTVDKKRVVWELYLDYERRRQEKGLCDFTDVLRLALASVTQKPVDGIDAVIVDEAQDLNLVGVRLVHALVGDRPNGLLLIGDAQQAVYSGGWRLVDAGINVRGARSVRFHTNYRNGANIVQAAEAVRRIIPDEDLDDTVIPAMDFAAAREGGEVIDFEAPKTGALDIGLVEAVRTFADHGGAAVLCRNHREAADYMRVLRREGLLVEDLEKYAAISSHAVKVGVFLRSKGFDFKAVFIPRYDLAFAEASAMKVGGDRASRPAIVLYVAMTRARDLLWRGGLSGTLGYGRNGEAGTV